MRSVLLVTACVIGLTPNSVGASNFVEGEIETDLVPSPVAYGVLLPDGYADASTPLPLVLMLHGGNGSHKELVNWKTIFDTLWMEAKFPKAVVAMASTGKRRQYMDLKDGSEKWESFIMDEFLEHVRDKYKMASKSREGTVVAGFSMGGLGTLRLGLKHPQAFAGLAAFEPSIVPALKWQDVKPRNRFFRPDEMYEEIYGKPMAPSYWEANNPASIADANAESIRGAGLEIYLECGDEDYLNLHEGAEFLHRVLWDLQIPHEYHLVRGADHLGRTIRPRSEEGLLFLSRVLNPPGPDHDPRLEQMKDNLREAKKEAERQ